MQLAGWIKGVDNDLVIVLPRGENWSGTFSHKTIPLDAAALRFITSDDDISCAIGVGEPNLMLGEKPTRVVSLVKFFVAFARVGRRDGDAWDVFLDVMLPV